MPNQKSPSRTSPPLRVPMARQVTRSMLLVIGRRAPSPKRTLTMLGCKLDGGTCMAMLDMLPGKPIPAHVRVLGAATWLYVVQHISPMTQLAPCLLVKGTAVVGSSALHV